MSKTRYVVDDSFSFVLPHPLPSRWRRWVIRKVCGWRLEAVEGQLEHRRNGEIRVRPENEAARLCPSGYGAARPAPEVQA